MDVLANNGLFMFHIQYPPQWLERRECGACFRGKLFLKMSCDERSCLIFYRYELQSDICFTLAGSGVKEIEHKTQTTHLPQSVRHIYIVPIPARQSYGTPKNSSNFKFRWLTDVTLWGRAEWNKKRQKVDGGWDPPGGSDPFWDLSSKNSKITIDALAQKGHIMISDYGLGKKKFLGLFLRQQQNTWVLQI